MAKREGKKKGGMKKIGRSKRSKDQEMSSFIRNLITADKYFKSKGLTTHHNYIRNIIN